MKRISLIILLFITAIFYGQKNSESYVLTNSGEKIKIVSGERVIVDNFNKINVITSVKYKKIDGDSAKFSSKTKEIRIKEVNKIVDGDRLYIPFQKKDVKKLRMCRVIARTDIYVLGHYHFAETRGHADGSGTYEKSTDRFVILDKEFNPIEDYRIYRKGKKADKKNAEGFAKLFNTFGNCIKRDNLYDKVPVKLINIYKFKFGRMIIEEGYSEEFLHTVNQLDCM